MLAAVFGLASALVFGAADFMGGMAAKYVGALRTTWLAGIFGLIFLLVFLPVLGGSFTAVGMFWGAMSGFAGALAIIFLYASLAIGPMSILSPLSAVVSAIVPVAWDLLGGTQLPWYGYIALVVALVAVVLVGIVPGEGALRPRWRGVIFAVIAGVLIGLFFIFINLAPEADGLAPLVMNRVASVGFTSILVAGAALLHWAHQKGKLGRLMKPTSDLATGDAGVLNWKMAIRFAIFGGLFDAIANTLTVFGLHLGDMAVVTVLVALYPSGTMILAAIFLKERLAKVQLIGLILAVASAAVLAVS